MRSNLTRTLAVVTALMVTGIGLSACVSNSHYDGYPRHSYDYPYRDSYRTYPRYGHYYHHHHHDRYRGHRWVARDGDGRRDWWKHRR